MDGEILWLMVDNNEKMFRIKMEDGRKAPKKPSSL